MTNPCGTRWERELVYGIDSAPNNSLAAKQEKALPKPFVDLSEASSLAQKEVKVLTNEENELRQSFDEYIGKKTQ